MCHAQIKYREKKLRLVSGQGFMAAATKSSLTAAENLWLLPDFRAFVFFSPTILTYRDELFS